MALEFEVDPDLTDKLRAEIVACWTDVSNEGGSVGFVPPVTMDDVQPFAERVFAGLLGGRDRLVIARDTGPGGWEVGLGGGESAVEHISTVDNSTANTELTGNTGLTGHTGLAAGAAKAGQVTAPDETAQHALGKGRLAGLAVMTDGQFQLADHWRKVKRVMVHPDFQGLGYGTRLMAEVERVGLEMGLEMLTLDCRGGTGNEEFYKKCGYSEYGRLPGALRLSADDYRDQVLMVLRLKG
ncbi:MAG: GNAT family N-acetyltransferase [Actinocrinis sp.]